MSCMNEILYRVGMNTCFSSTMCGTNIFSFSGLMVLPVGSGTSYHGAANFYCSRVPKFRGFPITPEACSKSIRHPYTSTLRELYSWFNVLVYIFFFLSNVAMTLQLTRRLQGTFDKVSWKEKKPTNYLKKQKKKNEKKTRNHKHLCSWSIFFDD